MQCFTRFLLLTITLLTTAQAKSQAPAIEWQKNYGGSNYDLAYSIKQTKDGGYIFVGSTASNDSDVTTQKGNGDVWVVKLNRIGQIQWQKSYGGSGNDDAMSIEQTKDGGYIIAANTSSKDGDVIGLHYVPNNPNTDYWIIKIDSVGIIQWTKTLGGTKDDLITNIIQTKDNGYIVVGHSESNDFDVSGNHSLPFAITLDCWIVKLDSIGNIQWQKCYGGTDEERAYSIIQTKDSNYVFLGTTFSADGDVAGKHQGLDVWLVKINKSGSLLWQKCLGGDGGDGLDLGNNIVEDIDGSLIFDATSNSKNGDITRNIGQIDIWIVKTDSLANIIWQKNYGGSQFENSNGICRTFDKGYIVIGSTNSNDSDVVGNHSGNYDYWLLKIDSNGNKQWQKCLGGTVTDLGASIIQTKDSGFICLGTIVSNDGDIAKNYGSQDMWVVKLKAYLLPLSFLQFTNQLVFENNTYSVKNSWIMGGSEGIIKYNIDRSEDGVFFYKVGWVGANSINHYEYNFNDTKLPNNSKVLFYRISAINITGSVLYSNINKVYYNQPQQSNVIIYPNPASNYIQITGKNIYAITISNSLGQVLFSENYINSIATKIINVQSFSKGVYYITLHSKNALTEIKKIVIQ